MEDDEQQQPQPSTSGLQTQSRGSKSQRRDPPAMGSLVRSLTAPSIGLAKQEQPCCSRRLRPLGQVQLKQHMLLSADTTEKRWTLLHQFIGYENDYLRTLQFVSHNVYDKLMKEDGILPRAQTRLIFGCLPELYLLHRHFDEWLLRVAAIGQQQDTAGWLFTAMLQQPALVQLYRVFICNYRRAQKLLDGLNRNAPFQRFVAQVMTPAQVKWESLDTLLLKPVVRIRQMSQQLRELLVFTPRSFADRERLQWCSMRAEQIADDLDGLRFQTELIDQLLGTSTTQLLHWADLEELFIDERGNLQQSKRRRVFLLDDRVICAKLSPGYRAPVPLARSATQRWLTLFQDGDTSIIKWMLPLIDVRFHVGAKQTLPPHSTETDSCNELLHLLEDYNTVSKIKTLTATLHADVEGLNTATMEAVMKLIATDILSKNQEVYKREREEEGCWMEITARPGARPDVGRLKEAVFHLGDRDATLKWRTMIRLALLGHMPQNISTWWSNSRTQFSPAEPMLVQRFTTAKGHLHTEITCGCYYAPNLLAPIYKRMKLRNWLRNRNTLWVCTANSSGTFVTLYTHDTLYDTLAERGIMTLLGEFVECAVHVPEGLVLPDDDTTADTLWLGTRRGLMIYSAAFPFDARQLAYVPINGTPKHMLYYRRRVYVGLEDGTLLMYECTENGWNIQLPLVVNEFTYQISAMLVMAGELYVAAGSTITTVGIRSNRLLRVMHVAPLRDKFGSLPTVDVEFMVHSPHGVWIVRHRSNIVSLFDADGSTWRHLQDINVADPMMRFVVERPSRFDRLSMLLPSMIQISSLAAGGGTLWIGTSVGILLSLALPERGDVPVLADWLRVSYHGHLGAIGLVMPLVLPVPKPDDGERSPPPGRVPDVASMCPYRRLSWQDLNAVESSPTNSLRQAEQEIEDQVDNKPPLPPRRKPGTVLTVTGGRGYVDWSSAVSNAAAPRAETNLKSADMRATKRTLMRRTTSFLSFSRTPSVVQRTPSEVAESEQDSEPPVSFSDSQIMLWEKEL